MKTFKKCEAVMVVDSYAGLYGEVKSVGDNEVVVSLNNGETQTYRPGELARA